MRPFFLLFFLGIFHQSYLAQATLNGKIQDNSLKSGLEKVTITIKEINKSTQSLNDGSYEFTNLPMGSYTLEVKRGGFTTQTFSNIALVDNEIKTINVDLKPTDKVTGLIKIKRTTNKETVVGSIAIQRSSNVMLDIVPQEVLKRTPARTVADALKQVSGASIQDNKFAVIRGLNDRYNAAYINGGPLPASEADRKAFSFDIFPVNMLENLSIVKTASPELPGEFAGGIIQIKTKDIPSEPFQSLSFGTGYNTITTFKNKVQSKEGKLDWIGIDDGSRALAKDFPAVENYPVNIHEQAAYAKQFQTNWNTQQSVFLPNFSGQYSGGFKKTLKKEQALGFIGSLSYNNTQNFNETVRRSYTDNAAGGGGSQIESDYLDKTYSQQILSGMMANVAYQINKKNKFSFKNVYSINTDLRIINRTGQREPLDANPTMIRSNANWMTQNQIYTGQINGEHGNEESKFKLDWLGSFSQVNRTIPKLRRNIYSRLSHFNDPTSPEPLDTTWVANISGSSVGPDYGGNMFFANTNEAIYSTRANVSYKLINEKDHNLELKSGVFTQWRTRNFQARQLGYTKYGGSGSAINFNSNLLYLPEDSIFSSANMGLIAPGVGGFKLTDGTKLSDLYEANSQLYAVYFMANQQIKNTNLIYGLRIEDFSQKLKATNMDGSKVNVDQHNLDFLPSLNLIHAISEKQNLRFSASQTLNRPEYRELAPFAFYDFSTQFVLSGNDSLQRAKITNLDARYEYYPSNGQLITASFFVKHFSNPIEQIARPDVMNEISYKNVGNAINYGLELEFKMNAGYVLKRDSSSWLNNLTFFTNLGFIQSKVDVSQNIGTPYNTRPLQGQSPYIFNLGLNYQTKSLWSMSANVNTVGSRIYVLGSVLQPDIWEKSRTFIDLQLSKSFLNKKLELKMNLQNLLAQNLVFYQNNYQVLRQDQGITRAINYLFYGNPQGDNRYEEGKDDLVWKTKFGRTFSFVATYKF